MGTRVNINKIDKISFKDLKSNYFLYNGDLCVAKINGPELMFSEGQSSPSYQNEGNALRLKDLEVLDINGDKEIIPVEEVNISYLVGMIKIK